MSKSYVSDKNVLKRHSSSGSTSMSAPSTNVTYAFQSSTTVNHNLGYIPQVRVYFENSASDGKVYPAGGRRVANSYDGLASNSIYCLWELTTTTLTIYLESGTTKTGNRTVYYVIYEDEDQ